MKRILFITPHSISSGEAITALHVAENVMARGAAVRFLSSQHTGSFLARRLPVATTIMTDDAAANRRLLDGALAEFRPDAVLFCDYSILPEDAGGVPLLSSDWLARLERFDAALLTFDHMGLEQRGTEMAPLRRIEHPARMRVLLPCPMHEPSPVAGRRGIPFRHWTPPAMPREARERARARYVGGSGYLVFHAVSPWAWRMAELKKNPYYQFLPAILEQYLTDLPLPVTVVSVNHGSLMPPAPRGELRVINAPPLPAEEYEALLASADLVLTENCFSASLGKAVCAGVPAVAWRNSFDLATLLGRLAGAAQAEIAQMVLSRPSAIEPWLSFPIWPPEIRRQLTVLDDSSIIGGFAHLEIFGGDETAGVIRGVLADPEVRGRMREAQMAYAKEVARLPDAHEAILAAVSQSEVTMARGAGEA